MSKVRASLSHQGCQAGNEMHLPIDSKTPKPHISTCTDKRVVLTQYVGAAIYVETTHVETEHIFEGEPDECALICSLLGTEH